MRFAAHNRTFPDNGAERSRLSYFVRSLVVVLLLCVGVQAASAAALNSVQSGTAIISNGSTSSSAIISAVDLSKAFLVFSVRHNVASPADGLVSGQITSPTNVIFLRMLKVLRFRDSKVPCVCLWT